MARYEDLTDKELQAKADAAGIKRAGSLTRDQLIAKLAEKGDTGGKKSDFVTPVVDRSTADAPTGEVVEPPATEERKVETQPASIPASSSTSAT